MASTKQNDSQKAGPAEVLKCHGLNLSHSKLESYSGITDENDKNSNLSPSKSTDPARKKTFKIISVKKGSGDVGGDNDADSIDGLDESQTEDLSSEFYDSSKATDLDMDLQDCINLPLSPDELTSTTTIVVKQKPDQNSQSRFKVVKIETKEPFRRGKWVCYDFFDTAPAAVVMVEKSDSKLTEESIIQSALCGNLSPSSSVHYVQEVRDSSSNIFIPPVVPMSPPRADGRPLASDVFVPIQPAPASQVLSQLDGLTSDVMAPFIAQQVLMSVAGVPSSSTSFHNLAQAGHTTIIQSLPHTSVFPFAQNGPAMGVFQNGVAGPSSQVITLPSDAMPVVGTATNSLLATSVPVTVDDKVHSQAPVIAGNVHSQASVMAGNVHSQASVMAGNVHSQAPVIAGSVHSQASVMAGNVHSQASVMAGNVHSQAPVIASSVPVPHSKSHTQIVGDAVTSPGVPLTVDTGPGSMIRPGAPASISHVPQSRTESTSVITGSETEDQMGPGMDESTGSVKTLQGDTDGQSSEGLKEAVEAVGEMYMGLEDEADDGGGSTVAIDNKIEQAMDLVKRHLMYAVREEVEILKQQIGEMLERIGQLEYENTVLRSEAKPETLNKLLQPRVTQPTQVALPTQPTPGVVASTQQQPATAAPQAQQAPVSQVGQPPSTT